jgi:hypothetical protein
MIIHKNKAKIIQKQGKDKAGIIALFSFLSGRADMGMELKNRSGSGAGN